VPSHRAQFLARTDLTAIVDRREKEETAAMIRRNLPELTSYLKVDFNTDGNYWLVHLATCRFPTALPLPLVIGGCAVYLYKKPTLDRMFWSLVYGGHYDVGGGLRNINPRRLLTKQVAFEVQDAFPTSIGCRLHFWGYVDIFYATFDDMDKEIDRLYERSRLPSRIFGFGYDMKVVVVEPLSGRPSQAQQSATSAASAQLPEQGTFKGRIVNATACNALVLGTDYWWEQSHLTRSYILRTESDENDVRGSWGAVVCIGASTAATCKAGMFQNYQTCRLHRKHFPKAGHN